jgi:hypothetical protein
MVMSVAFVLMITDGQDTQERASLGYRTSGPRWEIYGPHSDDPAQQWTEVYWLLSSPVT